MKNLKVGKRLILSFGIVLVLFIFSTIVVSISLSSTRAKLNQFYTVPWQTRGTAQDLEANLANQQKSLFRAIATTDETIITSALKDVEKYESEIQKNLKILYDKALKENREVIDNLAQKISAWNKIKDVALNMAADINISSNEISAYLQENSLSILEEVTAALTQTIGKTNETGEEFIKSTNQMQIFSTVLLIGMCFLSIVVGFYLSISVTKSITKPIEELKSAANEMAAGNLKAVLNYTSPDELGNLANSMRIMMERISYYMGEISIAMAQLASGDLNVKAREAFLGDFKPVQVAIRTLINTLNQTMLQINHSSGQVAVNADSVSSGAQALAQGAVEQAAAVQQLSATINEISEQVIQNAQSAKAVSIKATETEKDIVKSNEGMQEMIQAMQEISVSSEKIHNIMKTLDDIVSKTNMLALNVSVEAARLGTTGKSFAVIANEVRDLANKSSEASKTTAILIEDSLYSVEKGSKIADETAKALLRVVENAQSVTNTIEQISKATNEQAMAITQVTQGIDQISGVVQTASATAQESAATSEELSGQAQILKNLVGQFQLKEKM